jgi:HEAT repeat protein
MSIEPFAGAPATERFIADLLGVSTPEQVAFAKRLLSALVKIGPDLVPRALEHPYQAEIGMGVSALPGLIAALGSAEADAGKMAALDAMGAIAERELATADSIAAIRKALAETKSADVAAIAGKALAQSGDEAFIAQQRAFLASEKLPDVHTAALLLGWAKDEAAVPILLDVLTLDRIAVADAVIWALGEIGDERAVPKLHLFLERFILTEKVLDAVGRIGARVSVMRVLPVLLEGPETFREAAALALSRIIQRQEGRLGDRDLGRSVLSVLEKSSSSDPSLRVRLFAMLGIAGLGGQLAPNQILACLGGGLTETEVDSVGKLLAKRPSPKRKK